jgi:hypothetical protein
MKLKRSLSIAVASAAALAAVLIGSALVVIHLRTSEGVRLIDIPFEEHGYSNFESQVIRSQLQLDRFLERVAQQEESWNERDRFMHALRHGGVDFSREALVLVRHTEGSGAVEVRYRRPYIRARALTCRIVTRTPPACTCDMAYYCAAFVVPSERVDLVEVVVDGKVSAVLPVAEG